MADFTVSSMSSAVVGVASTVSFQANLISSYSLQISSGTKSTENVNLSNSRNTTPGWLTGRRPAKGQLFPRGIFNK